VNSIQNRSEINTSPGIGLQNIKRRLDILYSDNYHLNIENNKESFNVLLRLNTAKTPTDVR
ncbi:MAG: histidine kinase, partial [Salegentibacter sp.]